MEKRRLGRTNHMSSVVIFGSAALWDVDQTQANKTLDLALEAGVNHIDVAPQYGLAEERVGQWLPEYRSKFFLGCKTLEREQDKAWAELHVSLKKLQTEQFDLYQLHSIGTMEELDKAFANGGAIETLQRAKNEGLTRFLGITGHGTETPKVHLEALNRFDFDTVMFPLNPVQYADPEYRENTEKLLNVCMEREVGVQIIKSIAKQPWGDDDKAYTTWYRPQDIQEKITQWVRFALSQSGVTGIPSAGDTRLFPMVLKAAKNFMPMNEEEQETLIAQVQANDTIFV